MRCKACGAGYLTPRPNQRSIGRFYGNDYYSYNWDSEKEKKDRSLKGRLRATVMRHCLGYEAVDSADTLNIPTFLSRMFVSNVALPSFKPGGRVLDVGCGAGEKLQEFRNLGWDVRGIELSEAAARAGASRGIEISNRPIEAAPFPDAYFDAITFYHSLEHVPSPTAALLSCRRLLKPGGELLIVVPNFGGWERRIFGKEWGWMQIPVHFYHFDRKDLPRLLNKTGFAVKSVGYSFAGQAIDKLPEGPMRPAASLIKRFSTPFGIFCALAGSGKALVVSATNPKG